MVVKIQQSLSSSDGKKHILVYDQARKFYSQVDNPGIVRPIVKLLGERPKAYFEMSMDDQGLMLIKEEVPDPGW